MIQPLPEITKPNAHLPQHLQRDLLHNPVSSGMTPKQMESIKAADRMVNLWEGAVSSGKTVASQYRWLMFIAATLDLPGELVMTGRTRDSVWRNVLLPMMDLFPGTTSGNLGSPVARVLNQRVHVIGASDAKAENVIRGITCKGIYIDEATTIPESYFNMALSRLRVTGRLGGLASKLFATTNPDNPRHWLKEKFIDKKLDDWRVFHFTLRDNPRLSPEYIRALEQQYTGMFRKRFIEGRWVIGEGAVWDSFDEDTHVIDISELPRIDRILTVGIDFGSNHPTVGELLGVGEDRRLYALAEWVPMKGDLTLSPVRQAQSFHAWRAQLPKQWRDFEFIHADSAAKAFRDQFMDEGIYTAPAWKNVQGGLQLVHSLFSADRLRIVDTCEHLIGEIPNYVWDPAKIERGLDEPVKDKDDACDALRYAVYSTRSQWQGMVPLVFPTAIQEAA